MDNFKELSKKSREENSKMFFEILKKHTCQRCNKDTTTLTLSFMNTDILCEDCKEKERAYENYSECRFVENMLFKAERDQLVNEFKLEDREDGYSYIEYKDLKFKLVEKEPKDGKIKYNFVELIK